MTMKNRWIRPLEAFYSSNEDVKATRLENVRLREAFLRFNAAAEAEAARKRAVAEAEALRRRVAAEAEAARLKAEATARLTAEAEMRVRAEFEAAETARRAKNRGRREASQRYYEENAVAERDADKQRLKDLYSRQTEDAKKAYALRIFHLHGKPVRCLLCGCDMSSWRPIWAHDDPVCTECSGKSIRWTQTPYNGNLKDPFHERDDMSGGDSGWDLAVRRCEG